jgi:hypothetical protein
MVKLEQKISAVFAPKTRQGLLLDPVTYLPLKRVCFGSTENGYAFPTSQIPPCLAEGQSTYETLILSCVILIARHYLGQVFGSGEKFCT